MRIAALSDIHGNLPALEAVLHDVAREPPAVRPDGRLRARCQSRERRHAIWRTRGLLGVVRRWHPFSPHNYDRGAAADRIRKSSWPEAKAIARDNVPSVPSIEEAMEFFGRHGAP